MEIAWEIHLLRCSIIKSLNSPKQVINLTDLKASPGACTANTISIYFPLPRILFCYLPIKQYWKESPAITQLTPVVEEKHRESRWRWMAREEGQALVRSSSAQLIAKQSNRCHCSCHCCCSHPRRHPLAPSLSTAHCHHTYKRDRDSPGTFTLRGGEQSD